MMRRLPLMARNGHGPMSDLSPLSGEERKSNFGAVRSVDDPQRSSDFPKYPSFVQPYRLPSVGSGPIHCRKMILGGGHAATRVHRVYWRRGSMAAGGPGAAARQDTCRLHPMARSEQGRRRYPLYVDA